MNTDLLKLAEKLIDETTYNSLDRLINCEFETDYQTILKINFGEYLWMNYIAINFRDQLVFKIPLSDNKTKLKQKIEDKKIEIIDNFIKEKYPKLDEYQSPLISFEFPPPPKELQDSSTGLNPD